MPLTDTKIRTTKPADKVIRLQDGNGLYLEIRPSGAKIWRYRYWLTPTKEGTYSIGEYPKISLADARKAREWARAQVKLGLNPTRVRAAERMQTKAEHANTFEEIGREWIAHNKQHWSDRYHQLVSNTMSRDVFPHIGRFPIRIVNAAHILEIIRRVEARGSPVIAANIRQWCGQIFRYAVSTLRADMDPTGALRGALKRRQVRHNPPLAACDIPVFIERMNKYQGHPRTRLAFRLMLLTFVRTIEMRCATWAEIDFKSAEWRLPAARMKMGKYMLAGETHIVPLSRQALAVLQELQELTGDQHYLFPNRLNPRQPMSSSTINQALAYMGYARQFSGHGFRSTASTLLHEMGWRSELIERQLAHAERDKVKAAYNHAQYLTERRQMMQAWADYLDGLASGGEIIHLKQAR